MVRCCGTFPDLLVWANPLIPSPLNTLYVYDYMDGYCLVTEPCCRLLRGGLLLQEALDPPLVDTLPHPSSHTIHDNLQCEPWPSGVSSKTVQAGGGGLRPDAPVSLFCSTFVSPEIIMVFSFPFYLVFSIFLTNRSPNLAQVAQISHPYV